MVETIFVPRGAEERAVRTALGKTAIRVVATGIGPRAATRAADLALAQARFGTALITGLCGALSPAFVVGDALVYREIRSPHGRPIELEPALAASLGRRLVRGQTGIRAVHSDRIVAHASDKHALGIHYDAEAVDMESYALADRLGQAGVAVGVVRVTSDAVSDDLPELDRALDGSGGMDSFALALAFARSPLAAARLIAHATKALAALRDTVRAIVAAR
jgi:adenosylhomocysteine nucleosidase